MIRRVLCRRWTGRELTAFLVLLGSFAACAPDVDQDTRFVVTLTADTAGVPIDGRLYILLTPGAESEPLFAPPHTQRALAIDVEAWQTRTARAVNADALGGYPTRLGDIPPGEYTLRAVIDRDTTDWRTAWAPGNLYSSKTVIRIDPEKPTTIELVLEHVVEAPVFEPTDHIREVRMESTRVSEFAGRPQYLEAAVILPESYTEDTEPYPTVYILPGWGATHHSVLQGDFQQERYGMEGFGRDKVFVFLNHDMPLGAHCFANSDVIGPWGDALIQELIPHLEEKYRLIPDSKARFLVGQSSGAWGALWLQVEFPEEFGGAWAASPDFVDFRAFGHDLDLYGEDANIFVEADGSPRPGVRNPQSGQVVMTVRGSATRSEVILGADQMASFEAVFGGPDADGNPRPLFDRITGAVDDEVVALWSRFDLCRILLGRPEESLTALADRIHIRVGGTDDYYLNEAVERLKAALEEQGVDSDIAILDGIGHNVWDDKLRREMHESIDRTVERAGY